MRYTYRNNEGKNRRDRNLRGGITKTIEISKTKADKTVLKSLAQCSFALHGEPTAVDVKDGKILRMRPYHYDEKYTREEINPWRIEKDGKFVEQQMKAQLAAYQIAYKKRVYSPNRIKYPLKRVDWDPNGERNPRNRGKSKYKRISWDEATTIIVNEIKRIQEQYGPYALLCHGDGHGETKTIHGPHGCQMLLMSKAGGYTLACRNPDSWEGWWWGAKHVWGDGCMGLQRPTDNLLYDVTQNTEMLIHIGADLETTPAGFGSQVATRILYFWTSIGKKQVFVCPDLNYSAAIHANKWIPILPNTDAALQLAIAYTWITEGTYDKDYVATHVVGFDKFSDYVMGKEDGVPKTPEWASSKCGVPAWTIKALAREWASKVTSTIHFYGGSYIRGPYSTEPARLEVCLLGMQGLGKPGVHSYNTIGSSDMPRPAKAMTGFSQQLWSGRMWAAVTPQCIAKTLVHHAILNPPVSSWSSTMFFAPTEDQFKEYPYPIPKEQGGTEVHMIWMDNPCRTTCWNEGFLSTEAFRSPKIECFVVQHPWLENDTVFADIILPTNTKIEEEDIAQFSRGVGGTPFSGISIEEQAIEPIGESLSDYEAVGEVAKKLGLYEEYTNGMTVQEKIKVGFDNSGLDELISWEKFKEKSYYIVPTAPDFEKDPAGYRLFYDNPEKNSLNTYPSMIPTVAELYGLPTPVGGTPSGKLEFYSQRLADHFPDDEERPPSPKWVEKGPTHDERISSERAKKYPLLLITNHPRWRTHAQNDDITWLREIPTCKVKGWDGYMYEPIWLHPTDAAKRGIKSGDIVKMFNHRGTVLGGAIVWERIMPGVTYQDHGARADMIATGPDEYIDRGGANNLISPEKGLSQNCWGMATSGYLVEVEKVTLAQMEEWKGKYPEAFVREYDPASGLHFDAWVEEGM